VQGNNGFIYNKDEVDNLLTNYTQQHYFSASVLSGSYLRLATLYLPNAGTNIKIEITYSVAYPDINQQNILILHFLTSDGINLEPNSFNGSATGYSIGPLTVGNNIPSSNNGKQVIFKQLDTSHFEVWFYNTGYGISLVEITGNGLLNNSITYDGSTVSGTVDGITFIPNIYTFWNSNNLPYDTINGNLFGYYSTTYIDNNIYTKSYIDNTLANYFTKLQILSTTALANYYTKTTIDSYIDAKIDATYVLEMMYNAGGHQYLIAIDPTTNTTDLNIINKQNGKMIATFDINGSRFNTPIVGYSMTLLNPLTGNPTAIYNATAIGYYVPITINNSLTLLDSTQTHTTAIFNDANITFNLPVVCSSTLTATNIYTKN
jgi:hypothetical protein